MRLACAAAFALLLVAPAALAASDVRERVSPRTGSPDTVFRVGFTAPADRSYHVELRLGRGTGCTHSASAFVERARKGRRVRLALPPPDPWCLGRGRGTIYEHSPVVACNPPDPCPAEPSYVRPIARFAFRVSG
jgi:hypothetical protein